MSRHFEFFRDTYDVTEIAGAGARRAAKNYDPRVTTH